jgi:hypothetical protein
MVGYQKAANGSVPDIQMRFALRLGSFPSIFTQVLFSTETVFTCRSDLLQILSLGQPWCIRNFQSTYHIKEHTAFKSHIFRERCMRYFSRVKTFISSYRFFSQLPWPSIPELEGQLQTFVL